MEVEVESLAFGESERPRPSLPRTLPDHAHVVEHGPGIALARLERGRPRARPSLTGVES